MEDDTRRQKSMTSKKRSHSQLDNGRRKRANFGVDNGSGSSKPVETIYRILCPIKKIGSVLGRGGDIISALREETNAKIRVVDALDGAEERVIIIYNYAKQSGEVVTNENNHNAASSDGDLESMKPLCPSQDALLKIHDRIAADEAFNGGTMQEKDDNNEDIIARMLVPSSQVGCLLGKGGIIIQKLRADTGAGIRILPSDQLPPCAMESDELVQISGPTSLVRKALYEISTRLHQHPNKENPPLDVVIASSTQSLHEPPPALRQGNPSWTQQHAVFPPHMAWNDAYRNEPSPYAFGSYNRCLEVAEEFSMKILCPAGRIGGIIGKSGSTVKQLEEQTGARIQVEEINKGGEERIVLLSSKEVPSDRISPTIEALLLLQSKINVTPDKGQITTRLLIPSSKVGCILGEGGKIITEMRRRTGADIRIFSRDDKPKFLPSDEELVQVSGSSFVAREAVTEIALRVRARTFRSVSSADTAPPAPFRPPEELYFREYPPFGRTYRKSAPYDPFQGYPPVDRIPSQENSQYGSPLVMNAPASRYSRDYPPLRFAPADHLYDRDYPSDSRITGNSSIRDIPRTGLADHHANREYRTPASPPNSSARGSYYGYAPPESYHSQAVSAENYRSHGPPGESYLSRRPPAESYPSRARPLDSYDGRAYPPESYSSRAHPSESYPYQGPPGENFSSQGPPLENYSTRGSLPESYSTQELTGLRNFNSYGSYDYTEGTRQMHQSYYGPVADSRFSSTKSTIETRIPINVVDSVVGVGGINLTEIQKISGASVRLHEPQSGSSECAIEIHGTPDQLKAAQSLLQAFMSANGPGLPSSQTARPYQSSSAWS